MPARAATSPMVKIFGLTTIFLFTSTKVEVVGVAHESGRGHLPPRPDVSSLPSSEQQEMTQSSSGWREMFRGGRGLAAIVLMSGVALQAMETFIVSTLLPSVVGDIGGLELFAWNTTVFIVASIVAAIFAAIRPFGLGPRGSYILAAMGFALGSLICGLAPVMEVMLIGRAVQGFGAGLLTAMSYAMIRLVFPQHLWGRGFALISSVWGVSTLIGPAVGGVFATFDAWRWAFLILVPSAGLLGLLALRAIPSRSDESGMQAVPVLQ